MDSITNLQQYLLLCSTVISLDVIANSGSLQGQDNSIYTRIKLPTNWIWQIGSILCCVNLDILNETDGRLKVAPATLGRGDLVNLLTIVLCFSCIIAMVDNSKNKHSCPADFILQPRYKKVRSTCFLPLLLAIYLRWWPQSTVFYWV